MTLTRYGALARGAGWITQDGTGPLDGWQSIATIPSDQLVSGHTYTLIANALLGDIIGARKDVPSLEIYVEIAFRQGGSYWGLGDHRLDPMMRTYWAGDTPAAPAVWRHWGQPISAIYEFTSNGSALELIARIHGPGTPRGTNWECGGVGIDQVTLLAWDQTQLTSTYYRKDYSGSVTSMPASATDWLTVSGGGGVWVVYWAASVAAGAYNEARPANPGCVGWLESSLTPTYLFSQNRYARWGAQQVDYAPGSNRHWRGQQRMVGLGSAWTIKLRLADNEAAQGTHYKSFLFAVLLPDDFDPFLVTSSLQTGVPVNTVLPGTMYAQPFYGDYLYQEKTLAKPWTPYAAFYSLTTGGGRTILDVDSGNVLMPVQGPDRSGGFAAGAVTEVSGETHGLILRGEAVGDASPYSGLWGGPTDPYVYGFHLVVDDDPPVESEETPGPALEVDPGRETGLDPTALPELPYAPSLPVTLAVRPEVRTIEYASGYRVSHARFLRMRRQTSLRWLGLTVEECDALVVFFRGLMSTYGGAFRWRVPGDLEDSVWTCDPYSWRRDGSNTFELQALELVFCAEAPV